MNKQNKGLKRNTIDKFYTKKNIVELCYNSITDKINIDKNKDLIIEPSAGNGSFINKIKELCKNYKLYDLYPENKEIIKQDYLKLDYSKFNYNNIHVIGNPPFGRQSSMAMKFIKYSAQFCDSISFILPKSFKKESLKNKIPLNFHCIYQKDLPYNSFLLNDKEYDVPCVFQIWYKKKDNRKLPKKLFPKKFKFVKKDDNHDISFRRVGVNAGNIDTNTQNKSIQSHYFIKFNDKIFNNTFFNKLKNVKFNTSSDTVGPKSISKQELIKIYNKKIYNFIYNLQF